MQFPTKKLWSLAALLTFLFAATDVAFAQEQEFTQYNCAITPPANWHKPTKLPPSQINLVGAFTSPDKTRMVMVTIDERNPPMGPLDDNFVKGFERGIEAAGGGKRIAGKFIEIAGIKSYERLGKMASKDISTFMHVIPTGGKFYHIQALRFDGDAHDDPEIVQCVESFRFLKAPNPPPSIRDTVAYRAGLIFSRALGVLVIVGLIVLVFVLIRRKRRATPPPLPPTV